MATRLRTRVRMVRRWRASSAARRATRAARILDIGERLVQVRGFNGFSYADVAAELDMTKASPALPLPRQGRARTRR